MIYLSKNAYALKVKSFPEVKSLVSGLLGRKVSPLPLRGSGWSIRRCYRKIIDDSVTKNDLLVMCIVRNMGIQMSGGEFGI